jgi:hypothetical protein
MRIPLTSAGIENPTNGYWTNSEALFLLLIPVFFVQYGFKKTRYVSMGNSLRFVRLWKWW